MIDGKYEYFAFISYCWEDDKMAAELQKTLEGYKFPTSLREKNPNLPTKIRPVFRDKTDLNGHRLEESLMSALESSRYLIVICSPLATKSAWVNRGIQRFIDLGREKDIIPFIVNGEANADDPKNECFPPALRSLKGERAIYGININDNGRDAAAVKVVSRMFDVKYDTLWNRFLLEQKKRRRYTIAGLVAAILVFAGVAGYIWMQNQKIENQFKELQTKNEQIKQQNKDLDAKNDSILAANDRIQRAYEELDLSERNLAKSNADLKESNSRLAIEMENVKKANWETQINYAKLVAEKANALMEEDCYLNARKMLLSVLPSDENDKSTPLVPEVESAFRKSFESNSNRLDSYSSPSSSPVARFSDNKKNVAAFSTMGKSIRLLNSIDGNTVSFFDSICDISNDVMFFDDDKKLLVTSFRDYKVLDLEHHSIIDKGKFSGEVFDRKLYGILSITNAMDEKEKLVSIYDYIFNKQVMHEFIVDEQSYIDCAILYTNILDIKVAIAYRNGTVAVYNAESGTCEKKWKAHNDRIESLDYNESTGLFMTKSSNGLALEVRGFIGEKGAQRTDSLKIWDLETMSPKLQLNITESRGDAKFSHDGSYFVIRKNDHFQVLSSKDGHLLKESPVSVNSNSFDISADDKSIVFFNDKGHIHTWDVANVCNESIENTQGGVYNRQNAFSPDGRTCAVGMDKIVMFYDYKSNKRIKYLTVEDKAETLGVISLNYSKDGSKLVVSIGGVLGAVKIDVWDVTNSKKIRTLYHGMHDRSEMDATGRYVLSYNDQGICVFDLALKDSLQDNKNTITHNSSILYASFDSKTSNVVSSHVDGYIRIWDVNSLKCIDSIRVHEAYATCVQVSQDGEQMATSSSDKRIKIWDVKSKQLLKTLEGHTAEINYVAFSPNGRYVISTSSDNTLKLWDVQAGTLLGSYENHGSTASISPQNDYLVFLPASDHFRIQPIPTLQRLVKEAKMTFAK